MPCYYYLNLKMGSQWNKILGFLLKLSNWILLIRLNPSADSFHFVLKLCLMNLYSVWEWKGNFLADEYWPLNEVLPLGPPLAPLVIIGTMVWDVLSPLQSVSRIYTYKVNVDHLWGTWGSSKTCVELKTEPP